MPTAHVPDVLFGYGSRPYGTGAKSLSFLVHGRACVPQRTLLAAAAVLLLLTVLFPVQAPDVSQASGLEHSDEYYYNQMNDRDRALYRQIYSAAVNFETEFESGYADWNVDPEGKTDDKAQRGLYVLEAVRMDHPELIHLEAKISHWESGRVRLSFSMTESEYETAMAAIDSFVDSLGIGTGDRRHTIADMNEAIVLNTVYDLDAAHAHDMSGVFVDHHAVCEGYGLAFKYLCDLYSIPCICIIGDSTKDLTEKVGHLWNYVEVNGRWYAVDVTWDDPVPDGGSTPPASTEFLLVGSDTVHHFSSSSMDLKFSESHIDGIMTEFFPIPDLEENACPLLPLDTTYEGFDLGNPSTYYYDRLTTNGQKAYDAIVRGLTDFSTSIDTGVTGDNTAISDAIRAIMFDRQDLFQLHSSKDWTIHSDGRFTLTYTMTQKGYEEKRDAIMMSLIPLDRELMSCSSVFERVQAIHDYVISNCSYGYGSDDIRNLYGCLVDGKCVCEGYARTFQYVCSLYGIDVICVSGDGDNGSGKPEGHMWNYVRMNDGKWYCMDVTWDDPLSKGGDTGKVFYDYFLVGSETRNSDGKTFTESHAPDMAPTEGSTHVFDNSILPEVSRVDYYLRPGQSDEFVVPCTVESIGKGEESAKVTLDDLKAMDELMQGKGIAVIKFGDNGTKVGMTPKDLKLLIAYMDGKIDEIRFLSKVAEGTVKVGPLETQNDVYAFGIAEGTKSLKQSDIASDFSLRMYIPYSPSGFEFAEPLIKAWDVNTVKSVDGSRYENGFVIFESDDLSAGFVVGSTPVKGVTVPMIVVVLALVVLLVFLILRHHHRKKVEKRMMKKKKK